MKKEKFIYPQKRDINLDNIFNSFIKQTIFKNKIALQSSYTPETIPHREKQIMQIASILAPVLRLEKPSNLFIYGLTGTGKTLTVQYIKNQLLKKSKEQNIELAMPYVNCKLRKVADTEYRILVELIKKLGGKIPSTGLPTDQVYRNLLEIIDAKKQILVIILDEMDQAVKKIGDEFLYNFTRLNTELTKAQISVIGISNDLKFLDILDPRVKSSLSEEEILFPPYNAIQIQDILNQRVQESFKEGVISEGVIEKCSALAVRDHGDARKALDLLRIAGELVEREGKEKIILEYIDQAKEKMESDIILTSIETQPTQFQLTLFSILLLDKKNRSVSKKEERKKIYTGDVYNLYSDLCEKTKIPQLTQRRISDIIAEFDLLGIINAQNVSNGRYGRTREIRTDLSDELVFKIESKLSDSLGIEIKDSASVFR